MIISNQYFSRSVDAYANRIIGDTLTADLSQVLALIIEHLDAVCPVVGYEYLLFVVNHNSVGRASRRERV